MSSNGVETMSSHSSTPQTSAGSQTQSSTPGKQSARRRKTYHGTLSPQVRISNARSTKTANEGTIRTGEQDSCSKETSRTIDSARKCFRNGWTTDRGGRVGWGTLFYLRKLYERSILFIGTL
jgi:hypothetical protein